MRFSSVGLVAAVCTAALLSACGSDSPARSEGAYCTAVGDHLVDLNTPSIATAADVNRVLDSWRAVARTAPLAIEAEWDTVIASMETAATVDPKDPASVQKVADTARKAQPASDRVIDYTFTKCGATIGGVTPVTTVPPTPTT